MQIVMRKPSGEYEFVRHLVPVEDGKPLCTHIVIVRSRHKIGRNDPCPCNSGLKYKRCHMLLEREVR